MFLPRTGEKGSYFVRWIEKVSLAPEAGAPRVLIDNGGPRAQGRCPLLLSRNPCVVDDPGAWRRRAAHGSGRGAHRGGLYPDM